MANAQIVTLADEVVTQLNKKQGGWSVQFQAERRYQPKIDLEETDTVKVLVAIAAWRTAPDNRTDWAHEYDIDIGILFRASAKATDQPREKFDSFMKLVEDVSEYWESLRRTTIAGCTLLRVRFGDGDDQPYFPDHIETLNQITSRIRLTFWKLRDPDE